MEAGGARGVLNGGGVSESLGEKAKTPPGERHLSGRWGRIGPQFSAKGFGGRALHRSWSPTVRRWHPRVSGQVSAARLQADRMQVLLEWIGGAALRTDAH